MERKLAIKENAPELLEKQLALRARKGQIGIIVLSSATDPYLQTEKETQLTRRLLKIILKYRFPLHVITKSDLILRDLDVLKEIQNLAMMPKDLSSSLRSPLIISFSFSFLDETLRKIFEPGATSIEDRKNAFREVKAQGLYSGISLMPLFPELSDSDEHLENYYKTFSQLGADYIFPSSMTLFGNGSADSKTLVFKKIKEHFPSVLPTYDKLFSNPNYQRNYQNALLGRSAEVAKKYSIPSSLLAEG